MMRSVLVILGVFSVATLFAEVAGVAILWQRKQLTAESVKEIRLILTGEDQDVFIADEEADSSRPSSKDIVRERSMRILDLGTREQELSILTSMIDNKASNLSTLQQSFDKQRNEFEERLQQLNESITAESAEQARGILLKLPETNAVTNLMGLELQQNIALLQGMTEKDIARILEQFATGTTEQAERGQEIFQSLSKGAEPKSLVDDAIQRLSSRGAPQAN